MYDVFSLLHTYYSDIASRTPLKDSVGENYVCFLPVHFFQGRNRHWMHTMTQQGLFNVASVLMKGFHFLGIKSEVKIAPCHVKASS